MSSHEYARELIQEIFKSKGRLDINGLQLSVLIESLGNSSLRIAAVRSLGILGHKSRAAMPELVTLLKISEKELHATVVEALTRIQRKTALHAKRKKASKLDFDRSRYPVIGIDLGTAYVKVCYLNSKGQPNVIHDEAGNALIPSVVFADGTNVLIGHQAVKAEQSHPQFAIRNPKSFLFDPAIRFPRARPIYSPLEVQSLLLSEVKSMAQRFLKTPIEHAVITYPVSFSQKEINATQEAARIAGLIPVAVREEPTAAAVNFWIGGRDGGADHQFLANNTRFLVFDLGAGTFDLCVIDFEKEQFQAVGRIGGRGLGGNKWTEQLVQHLKRITAMELENAPSSVEWEHQLERAAEQIKRKLTDLTETTVALTRSDGSTASLTITRSTFEAITSQHLEKVMSMTHQLIKQSIGSKEIEHLLVTGGASRMPMVARALQTLPSIPENAVTTLDYDYSVSQGSALYGAMRHIRKLATRKSVEDTAFSSIREIRSAPRDIGLLLRDPKNHLYFHSLVASGTPLPASARVTVGTVVPNQRFARLKIVGRSPITNETSILGYCEIVNLPPKLAVGSTIKVRLKLDQNALIRVRATATKSGETVMAKFVLLEESSDNDKALDVLPPEDPSIQSDQYAEFGNEPVEENAPEQNDPILVHDANSVSLFRAKLKMSICDKPRSLAFHRGQPAESSNGRISPKRFEQTKLAMLEVLREFVKDVHCEIDISRVYSEGIAYPETLPTRKLPRLESPFLVVPRISGVSLWHAGLQVDYTNDGFEEGGFTFKDEPDPMPHSETIKREQFIDLLIELFDKLRGFIESGGEVELPALGTNIVYDSGESGNNTRNWSGFADVVDDFCS